MMVIVTIVVVVTMTNCYGFLWWLFYIIVMDCLIYEMYVKIGDEM